MNFVVTVFNDLFVYILFIGLQVQNKSICQSSFYVGRKIRDKQSKSKTVIKSNQKRKLCYSNQNSNQKWKLCYSSSSSFGEYPLQVRHKQDWGRGFILLLPQTAALPGSDAGSDVIKPASSFVIQNRQTSCSMWCPMYRAHC